MHQEACQRVYPADLLARDVCVSVLKYAGQAINLQELPWDLHRHATDLQKLLWDLFQRRLTIENQRSALFSVAGIADHKHIAVIELRERVLPLCCPVPSPGEKAQPHAPPHARMSP